MTIVLSSVNFTDYSMAGGDEVPNFMCRADDRFMGIGATKILDNRQVVMTLDHDVQNKSEKVTNSETVF
jgi:hypothetical protein